MQFFRSHLKGTARVVLVAFLAASLYMPALQASMVSTATAISQAQVDQERAHITQLLARQDVRQRLQASGVDPAKVESRVAALTDAEVHQLSTQIDSLPAGGDDLIGALVFIFIVLLITDILGLTDIFPFVKKSHH